MLGVGETTTVKLLGTVSLEVSLDEQNRTLFWPRPSSFSFEIKGFPSRKHFQEGLLVGSKLPITDTLVPMERINSYNMKFILTCEKEGKAPRSK